MTLDDRIFIEKELDKGSRFNVIAASLGKDPTTISKEVKKHRIIQKHNPFNEPKNKCIHFPKCKKKQLCNMHTAYCSRVCRLCPYCNSHCDDFEPRDYHCKKTDHAPYVCNGCEKRTKCRLEKFFYRAETSYRQYRTDLSESRTGINISKQDLDVLDSIVTPLIRQGHSPYTILQNHPEIALSEKTLYNYIDSGALSVKNIDLPKKVKYKVRSVHKTEICDTSVFQNRTYKDFCSLVSSSPDIRIVEMDTVIGCEGSHKVLLTFHFDCCNLMLAQLLDSKESKQVESVFDQIDASLGTVIFNSVFPVILTDRGGEFKHPEKLECNKENFVRTSIFYCDPMCSWQKPHCEKNHEYIRKICPKGTSFDQLTQFDINLMMNHINCSPRASLGGHTPLELARMMLPKSLLDFFNVRNLAPDDVILTPKLLKGKI